VKAAATTPKIAFNNNHGENKHTALTYSASSPIIGNQLQMFMRLRSSSYLIRIIKANGIRLANAPIPKGKLDLGDG
jgi:hypothetical protein